MATFNITTKAAARSLKLNDNIWGPFDLSESPRTDLDKCEMTRANIIKCKIEHRRLITRV